MKNTLLTYVLLVGSLSVLWSSCYKAELPLAAADINLEVSEDGKQVSTSVKSTSDGSIDISLSIALFDEDMTRIDFRKVDYEGLEPDQFAQNAPLNIDLDYFCLKAKATVSVANRTPKDQDLDVDSPYACD